MFICVGKQSVNSPWAFNSGLKSNSQWRNSNTPLTWCCNFRDDYEEHLSGGYINPYIHIQRGIEAVQAGYTTPLIVLWFPVWVCYVSVHCGVAFPWLLMHAVLCGKWESCVGSSIFTHRLGAATPHSCTYSVCSSKRIMIFYRSYKQYVHRCHSNVIHNKVKENPCL